MSVSYAHEIINIEKKDFCYGCFLGLENQMGHIGGCIPDDTISSSPSQISLEDDEQYLTSPEPSLELNIQGHHSTDLPDHLIDILEHNHFVAMVIPTYFTNPPYFNSVIEDAKNEYDLNIEEGDWVFTSYHVPHDIARAGAEAFNWDHMYKMPLEYVNKMEYLNGTNIRYGLPVGEEFVEPIKRQYYGHPALFDLKTNKTFDWTQSKKRGMKKLYEYNQLRLKNIERCGLNVMSYKLN